MGFAKLGPGPRLAPFAWAALAAALLLAVACALPPVAPQAIDEAHADSPPSTGNRVVLLRDGPAAYRAMHAAIEAARNHVNLETYAIEDDEVGQRFAQALVDACRRGVKVHLLYDAVGSINTPKEYFSRLREAGVQVLAYNPPLDLRKLRDPNVRNHRKLLVVDGHTAFVGGLNISGVYASGSFARRGTKDGRPPWRDTQLQLEGPVVADLQRSFFEAWRRQKGAEPSVPGAFPRIEPRGKEVVRAVSSWGGDGTSAVHVTLVAAIRESTKAVHITMAYFVPDPQFAEALAEAAARGVDVQLIVPGFTDFWAVFHAGRSHYEALLAAGVKIHERRSRLLHAKTAVIDGTWSTVGSANLDWRSFLHNHELNAVVLGPEFGAQMEAMFAQDLGASEPVTLAAWERRSLADRAREAAARLWEYWL